MIEVKGLPWKGAQILVRCPHEQLPSKPWLYPLVNEKSRLRGLPVGEYPVSIVVGTRVLVTSDCKLEAGRTTQVAFDLSGISVPNLVETQGVLSIPKEWAAKLQAFRNERWSQENPDFELEPEEGIWFPNEHQFRYRLEKLSHSESHGHDEYHLTAILREGRYRLRIRSLGFARTFSVNPEHAHWSVKVPGAVDWQIYVVDVETGDPVRVRIDVHPADVDPLTAARFPFAMQERSEAKATIIEGPILVSGWGESHYVNTRLEKPNATGNRVDAIRLHTLSLQFVDSDGSPLPVPRGIRVVPLSADEVPWSTVHRTEGGIRTFLFKTPIAGKVCLVVPEASGFEPIEREIHLEGKVEQKITLKRSR